MELKNRLLMVMTSAVCMASAFADPSGCDELTPELDLSSEPQVVSNENCRLYIIHNRDTAYDEQFSATDIAMSDDLNEKQLAYFAEMLLELNIDAIYSLDSPPSLQGAELLQQGQECEVVVDTTLVEEGLSETELAHLAIGAIEEIYRKHPGQNVVVVADDSILKLVDFLQQNDISKEIAEVSDEQIVDGSDSPENV